MKKLSSRTLIFAAIALLFIMVPFVVGVAAIAAKAGAMAGVAIVLALLTLPTLFGERVFGAYPNKLRIEGLSDSFMADPNGSTIAAFTRCKFVNSSATPDGTPILQAASATERGSVVTLQPIAAGSYGAVAPLNGSGGTILALCSGTIANGADTYAAASGKVSASSGGGALLLGKATCNGADGGTVSYEPNPAAA